jgi:hypothetical protein
MGKCPDTRGINCNYVGCCPWNEPCNDDTEESPDGFWGDFTETDDGHIFGDEEDVPSEDGHIFGDEED